MFSGAQTAMPLQAASSSHRIEEDVFVRILRVREHGGNLKAVLEQRLQASATNVMIP